MNNKVAEKSVQKDLTLQKIKRMVMRCPNCTVDVLGWYKSKSSQKEAAVNAVKKLSNWKELDNAIFLIELHCKLRNVNFKKVK